MELIILDSRVSTRYATPGSSAFDLHACSAHGEKLDDGIECVIPAGQTIMIGTGIAIDLGSIVQPAPSCGQIEASVAGLILPRSGVGCKQGLVPGNLVGLIDSDYHGEIKVCLWNRTNQAQTIKALDRIAQLLIVPTLKPVFMVVKNFSRETERGTGGFGSTGQ